MFHVLDARVARAFVAAAFFLCAYAAGGPNPVRADAVSGTSDTQSSAEADSADTSGAESDTSDAVPPCETTDVDRDGLCDEIEVATGTKSLRADTDADGVPDGVEDRNQDGTVDPGESDPRVPGLFPGLYPHIPEPLVFDLIRGLGAKKGEIEVNNLAVLDLRRSHRGLLWAPEVEWAIIDGVAVELELPMHNRELEAVKGAFQTTLPIGRESITHGLQLIGEYQLDARDVEVTALYLFGGRVGQWSMLGMAGTRLSTPMQARSHYEALLNPGVYVDLTERVTLGIEGNIAFGFQGDHLLAVIPQVHWQLTRNVRLQLGAGARLYAGLLHPLLAARIVLE